MKVNLSNKIVFYFQLASFFPISFQWSTIGAKVVIYWIAPVKLRYIPVFGIIHEIYKKNEYLDLKNIPILQR